MATRSEKATRSTDDQPEVQNDSRTIGGLVRHFGPTVAVFVLFAWCTILTVLLMTDGGDDDRSIDALRATQDHVATIDEAIDGTGNELHGLQAEFTEFRQRAHDDIAYAIDSSESLTGSVDALSDLVGGLGDRLDASDTEFANLRSAIFGFGPSLLDYDEIGTLRRCVASNFSDIDRFAVGFSSFLFLQNCGL
jgi:hypothetical protein